MAEPVGHPTPTQRPEWGGVATAEEASEERSTGDVLRAVAEDTRTLAEKQVQLARNEFREILDARLKAAAAGGVVALLGLLILYWTSYAAYQALDLALPQWAAALALAGAFVALAVPAAAYAYARLREPSNRPEQTEKTLKEDAEWLKTRARQ